MIDFNIGLPSVLKSVFLSLSHQHTVNRYTDIQHHQSANQQSQRWAHVQASNAAKKKGASKETKKEKMREIEREVDIGDTNPNPFESGKMAQCSMRWNIR